MGNSFPHPCWKSPKAPYPGRSREKRAGNFQKYLDKACRMCYTFLYANSCTGAISSVGQSSRLITGRSKVRVLDGPGPAARTGRHGVSAAVWGSDPTMMWFVRRSDRRKRCCAYIWNCIWGMIRTGCPLFCCPGSRTGRHGVSAAVWGSDPMMIRLDGKWCRGHIYNNEGMVFRPFLFLFSPVSGGYVLSSIRIARVSVEWIRAYFNHTCRKNTLRIKIIRVKFPWLEKIRIFFSIFFIYVLTKHVECAIMQLR